MAGEDIDDIKRKAHRCTVESDIGGVIAIYVAGERGVSAAESQGGGKYDRDAAEARSKLYYLCTRGIVSGDDRLAQ